MNSRGIPDQLVYDGRAIATVLTVTVGGLVSGQEYWLAYRALNRAGWSNLSPYLKLTAGRLPAAPPSTPYQIRNVHLTPNTSTEHEIIGSRLH